VIRIGGTRVTALPLALAATLVGSTALGAPPEDMVRKAIVHVEAQRFELARSYLDPVVIDPRLNASQRSRAYYLRGYTFLAEGYDVSAAQDYARALEFDSGNAEALESIAYLHLEGRGVARDERRAFELFLRSARAGHTDSKAYVGYALLVGRGTATDVDKARFWLGEAAEAGNVVALVHLARSYRAPLATVPDPARAAELYEQAITRGSTEALVGLGYMHLEGELGAPDAPLAALYFERAADNDSAEGQTALAHLYLAGTGVAQNDRRARALFETAAGKQHPPALTALAYLYEAGRAGLPRDDERAQSLYLEAATAGDPIAQNRLASRYLREPTEENTREALVWFRAAAEHDPSARNALAWVLATTRFDGLRDGAAAVVAAESTVAELHSASTLDTLAAALAEAGDFDRAVAVQRDAIAALKPEESSLRAEFDERLGAYERGESWRE
jgi:TPR repeat protein